MLLKHHREDLLEILQLAGRDETPEEARWALYSIIIYANEYGQPKSQDLADGYPVSILYLYTI
jgi:hypothetical protein